MTLSANFLSAFVSFIAENKRLTTHSLVLINQFKKLKATRDKHGFKHLEHEVEKLLKAEYFVTIQVHCETIFFVFSDPPTVCGVC